MIRTHAQARKLASSRRPATLPPSTASPATSHPAVRQILHAPRPQAMFTMGAPLEARLGALRGAGIPLPPAERAFFEPRFGSDFGDVRIHTGSEANDLARRVEARAFTLGRSIVFGARQYAPGTAAGRTLLAHELTHVVQQRGAPSAAPPVLRRWAISGNTATSDRSGDTLEELARSITGHSDDWMCIKPLFMSKKPRGTRYPDFVSPADRFDVSNLTASTGPSLGLHFFLPATEPRDVAIAQRFYPGMVSSSHPDRKIATDAESGTTPIQSLVLFGHAIGQQMHGQAGVFTPSDFKPHSPEPTFERAKAGLLPRRCWFTRHAKARAVGCASTTFGEAFAKVYLRQGASIRTTTLPVQPRCRQLTGFPVFPTLCPIEGLAFVDLLSRPKPLIGPFWSVAEFHAAEGVWTNVDGKL